MVWSGDIPRALDKGRNGYWPLPLLYVNIKIVYWSKLGFTATSQTRRSRKLFPVHIFPFPFRATQHIALHPVLVVFHRKYPRTTDTGQAKQGCKFDSDMLLYLQLTIVSSIAPGIKEKIVREEVYEWPYGELEKKLRDAGIFGSDSTGNRWHKNLRAYIQIIVGKEKIQGNTEVLKNLYAKKIN